MSTFIRHSRGVLRSLKAGWRTLPRFWRWLSICLVGSVALTHIVPLHTAAAHVSSVTILLFAVFAALGMTVALWRGKWGHSALYYGLGYLYLSAIPQVHHRAWWTHVEWSHLGLWFGVISNLDLLMFGTAVIAIVWFVARRTLSC